ncbi:MAG: hypothetical protein IKT43_00980 [Clostridia bacterium]|nr:hypothetical protein [Clostridia bacterium]
MKRFSARSAAVFLALFLLLAPLNAYALSADDTSYPPPTPLSECAIIYNLQYETVLFEKNADLPIYPASFAKVMTAILCYEYRATLGTNVPITILSEDDLSVNGIGLQVDEVVDFDTLLSAMVIGSANDAATVLARVVSGSVSEFVNRMNERASELGCTETLFCNPTGLHNGAAQTTLSDIKKICARAYEINDYMQTASLLRFEVPITNKSDKVRVLTNSNLLLNPRTDLGYYVKGAMGINHGYTPESGYCVSSVLDAGGAINLVLVAGGYKDENKNNSALLDAKEMFDFAKKAFEVTTVLKKESVIREVEVRLSDSHDHVLLIAGSNVNALLPVGYNAVTDIEQRIFLREEVLTAPIVEGTSYGSLELYYKGEYIGQTELVAQRSLTQSTSLALLDSVESFLRLPLVRMILIIIALAILGFLAVCVILLIIQHRRKSGMTLKEKRAQKRLEKELIQKEKARQEEYFETLRVARRKRNAEIREEFRQARERHLKEQAEAQRRADERARRAAAAERRRTMQNLASPAEGSLPKKTVKRPAQGDTAPVKKTSQQLTRPQGVQSANTPKTPTQRKNAPTQNPPKKQSGAGNAKRPKQP